MTEPLKRQTHTIEEIIDFLCGVKAEGSYGTTELIWQGHDIVRIQHTASYKPGSLPRPVAT